MVAHIYSACFLNVRLNECVTWSLAKSEIWEDLKSCREVGRDGAAEGSPDFDDGATSLTRRLRTTIASILRK
jgi:hypothetical protein